jgi:V-type H+-transporting ATPase subunit a
LGAIANLTQEMNEKREHRYVLDLCTKVLDAAMDGGGGVSSTYDPHVTTQPFGDDSMGGQATSLIEMGGSSAGQVDHICGVINADRAERFRATLFRVMRSNVVITILPLYEPLSDPRTGEKVNKSVFIAFLTSATMLEKAKKICDAFACNQYECPRMDAVALQQRIKDKELQEKDIESLLTVIKQTEDLNVEFYWKVANSLKTWNNVINRERKIYHALNKFVAGAQHMHAECWIPKKKESLIQSVLQAGASNGEKGYLETESMQAAEEAAVKPTYFATNKYTGAFQGIVNAYGVAHYREANPTLFALSIFPFLFGVMFGDILHGSFLLIFSLMCIWKEDKLKEVDNEMFTIPFGGRYLLFIMSVSAIYMGFIYNEVASVPLDLFGSAYGTENTKTAVWLNASSFETTPYAFGVDPVWRWSSNNVQFTNSMKMKMAIILGVLHMTLGVILKAFNKLHFKDMVSFVNESIPEFVLFMAVFGYLLILIFVKWSTNWNVGPECWTVGANSVTMNKVCDNEYARIQYPRGPPMIITTLIDFAFLGSVKHKDVLIFPESCEDGPDGFCSGQTHLQYFLIALAGISVPWLLLVKPFILKKEMDAHAAAHASDHAEYASLNAPSDDDHEVAVSGGEDNGDEHSFAEVFIHQVIHTIEYALGTVSNTASYLRLWALSLAHSQLSEVFWDMIFVGKKFGVGLNGGVPMLVMCFAIWFAATMAVLMVMESLSAFLHALRLQWVEFQNKFYQSDGILFVPDTFEEEESE